MFENHILTMREIKESSHKIKSCLYFPKNQNKSITKFSSLDKDLIILRTKYLNHTRFKKNYENNKEQNLCKNKEKKLCKN